MCSTHDLDFFFSLQLHRRLFLTLPAEAAVAPRSSSEDGAYVQDPAAVEYDSDLHVECPPHTTERRLVNRIDFRVIPYLCILYLLAFLDRVNIANANVFGLSEELGLASANSMKYNTALVIFFVPYVLFEIPSNVLMKKFKPNVWRTWDPFFLTARNADFLTS